jgi:hypothetical protein
MNTLELEAFRAKYEVKPVWAQTIQDHCAHFGMVYVARPKVANLARYQFHVMIVISCLLGGIK